MKNRRQRNRHELKKAREVRNIMIAMALIAVILIGLCLFITRGRPQYGQVAPLEEPDIETYIRSKTSEKQVAKGYEPVILYYRYPGMTKDRFCCVGTVVSDKEYGTMVLTAEHVFRNDITEKQIISFRPLRREVNEPTYYFNKIVKSSKDLGGNDALFATFGTEPVEFDRFSKFVNHEEAKHFYGDVEVRGIKVPTVTSLVSGEKIPTFGYNQRGTNLTDQVFILIEYRARTGESGTGFIDDNGGIWVLHGSPESEAEQQLVLTEYEKLMHKKIRAAAAICGPFGGKYQ